jgi:hypothetical protein
LTFDFRFAVLVRERGNRKSLPITHYPLPA